MGLICNIVEGREGSEGCPVSLSCSFPRLRDINVSGDNGDKVGLVSMEIESILCEMLMGGESCIAATGVDGASSIFQFRRPF